MDGTVTNVSNYLKSNLEGTIVELKLTKHLAHVNE